MMFGQLTDKFSAVLETLSGRGKINESNVREAMEQVRIALLEADVHQQVVDAFCARVLQQSLGVRVLESVRPGQQMIKIVYDELVRLMGGEEEDQVPDIDNESGAFDGSMPGSVGGGSSGGTSGGGSGGISGGVMLVSPGPTIIMMAGLQGSGKTTTCGKMAAYFRKKGLKVMLAAVDLQRPAAVTQLEVLAGQVGQLPGAAAGGVEFYAEPDKVAEYGRAVGAAVTVAKNAVAAARQKQMDVLILDTAGRLHVNSQLMDELKQINTAVGPHHILLVLDAMTGQDAVASAKAFNDQLELDGVILTKFDSDTRGGAALSVRHVTGKPLKFVGVGEKLDALEEFHPQRVASRILGMGDVVSLVEKAQEQVSEDEARALQEKMAKGKMTMDDFLNQLRSIRRMGPIKSLLGMLPGIGSQLKDLPLDEKQIDRTEAIICSMTPQERKNPELLDNSRRRRISRGSGTRPEDVSQLVKGFNMVTAMSRQMAAMNTLSRLKAMTGLSQMDLSALGGGAGMPGMPAMDKKPDRPKFKERKRKSR